MDNKKSKLGKFGENVAEKYLTGKANCRIIARNYRRKSDEIDIIAASVDGTLIFCEVKTLLKNPDFPDGLIPEDNLTSAKYRKISRTCEFFAREHQELISEDKGWRIDLLAIDISPDGAVKDIRHYENI